MGNMCTQGPTDDDHDGAVSRHKSNVTSNKAFSIRSRSNLEEFQGFEEVDLSEMSFLGGEERITNYKSSQMVGISRTTNEPHPSMLVQVMNKPSKRALRTLGSIKS